MDNCDMHCGHTCVREKDDMNTIVECLNQTCQCKFNVDLVQLVTALTAKSVEPMSQITEDVQTLSSTNIEEEISDVETAVETSV